MPIDTGKVTSRRSVSYTSLQEVLADAERLSSVPVRTLGNWSAGQIFSHLARTMNGSIDGVGYTIPWHLRMMGRMMKKGFLKGPMPAGFNLPAAARTELVPGPCTTEEGLNELRQAIARLEKENKRAPNAFLGNLTLEEWNQLHLIHSALHMSFLVEPN